MVAAYLRISKEESGKTNKMNDSNSIDSQLKQINSYITKMNLGQFRIYKDDGFSGTDFNRPAIKKLFDDISCKEIDCVIVKDLSRLGRDYVTTGYLVERYFPNHNIRFIAINDDVDTAGEDNELLPFKNIFNDWYARDISRKIRSAKYAKAITGQRINRVAPYGFKTVKEDKSFSLITDKEKEYIIQLIFLEYANGTSVSTIIKMLNTMNVLSPRNSKRLNRTYGSNGIDEINSTISTIERQDEQDLCRWNPKTIYDILGREEYIGNTVSLRRKRISYKNHKEVKNDKNNVLVFYNTHTAIIDLELWNRVQKRLKKI